MYKFSKSSQEKLSQCDIKLQELAHLALLYTEIDFGISEGHRTIRQQKRLYTFGREYPNKNLKIVTMCDGVNKLSKHNSIPSQAIDIFAYVDGKASWDAEHYKIINNAFKKASEELNINYKWGGNFKSKNNFKDYPHFEI